MAKKPDAEKEKKAFVICLVGQLNDASYQSSLSIEAMLDLMEKAKDKEEFEKILAQLSQFAAHHSHLATNISKHVESLKENLCGPEKVTTSVTQVH